jgi:cytochrome P450
VRGTLLWGPASGLREDPLGFLGWAHERYGDVVAVGGLGADLLLVRHPDHVHRIFVEHRDNYDKGTRGYDVLRTYLNQGLLTSEGEFWRRQRRIAQPAFHRRKIAAFAEAMVRLSDEVAQRWLTAAARGATLDVDREMMGLTLAIVSETLLGSGTGARAEQVGEAVEVMSRWARVAMFNPFTLPLWVPTASNREIARHGAVLDAVVYGIIEQRRASGSEAEDLLGMLMHARDEETGEGMTDQQLRDEVMTMFLAGHETTANALGWTFCLLSRHPTVRARLEAELDEVLGGRLPTLDDLPRLVFTERVVKESLRLYPPAWSVGRRAIAADVLGDVAVPAGALVIAAPWSTHRHPDFWPNPEGFDPERFTPEREHARHKYAYFPFAAGPRVCIGNAFAMMEAVLALATIAARVRVSLVAGHPVVPEPLITLRPRYGLAMTPSARPT